VLYFLTFFDFSVCRGHNNPSNLIGIIFLNLSVLLGIPKNRGMVCLVYLSFIGYSEVILVLRKSYRFLYFSVLFTPLAWFFRRSQGGGGAQPSGGKTPLQLVTSQKRVLSLFFLPNSSPISIFYPYLYTPTNTPAYPLTNVNRG